METSQKRVHHVKGKAVCAKTPFSTWLPEMEILRESGKEHRSGAEGDGELNSPGTL